VASATAMQPMATMQPFVPAAKPVQQQQQMVQQAAFVPTTQIVQQVPVANFGRSAAAVTCPYCNRNGVTALRSKIDGITIVAIVVLLFLFWPLFWLPLCIPGCKRTDHYCQHCGKKLGEVSACS